MSRLIYKYRDAISVLFILGLLILTMQVKPYFKGGLVVWSTLIFAEAFLLFLLIVETIAKKIK
jgi:hypothetical protein|tara:strand:+ start:520 stop:708 length:189 start_codon:yes stop_codon:yes gene_type:complete